MDDADEELGADDKNFYKLNLSDQEVLDSKVFMNASTVQGEKHRRGTNDTAGSVIMW